MEVVGRVLGRRNWSVEEKLEILAEAFRPGVRVRDVLERREISSGLVYTWRKQARLGKLGGVVPAPPIFAQVRVAEVAAPAPQPATSTPGIICIELPGGVRVSVDGWRSGAGAVGAEVSPTPLPARVFLACGVTDMRKGFDGLAVLVQQMLLLAQNHILVRCSHSGASAVTSSSCCGSTASVCASSSSGWTGVASSGP
jgi:transposase